MQNLREILAHEAHLKTLYPEGDDKPSMWDYWLEKKGFAGALADYYPGTLASDEEIRTLFYVWKATEQRSLKDRICEIMNERSEKWKYEHEYD